MINVSEVKTAVPETFRTPLQQQVYAMLQELQIPFERVDNDPALTMEDCEAIDARLHVKTVKTLFLCNRQQTAFYLFVTPGDKPFVTKNFGRALAVSRVSFAPPERLLSMLGTVVGATTVYSLLLDKTQQVRLVIDKAVLEESFYGCTDGTTTGYMRIPMQDLTDKVLPYLQHNPTFIEV